MGFLERAKPPIRAIGVCAAVSVPCCFFTGMEVAERSRLAFICWSLAAFEDSMVAVVLVLVLEIDWRRFSCCARSREGTIWEVCGLV